jgi:hypothetical protein
VQVPGRLLVLNTPLAACWNVRRFSNSSSVNVTLPTLSQKVDECKPLAGG